MTNSPGPRNEPSMADLAREAGVTKMTVSRVLNDRPHVSADAKAKVLSAVEKLGYRKNNLVSTVMTQVVRSRSVDYHTPIVFLCDAFTQKLDRKNRSMQMLYQGAREQARKYGFGFEVMYYRDGSLTPKRINQILESRNIQAVAVNVSYRPSSEPLSLNWERLVAATCWGRLYEPANLSQVMPDIPRALRTCFSQLAGRGYQRLGVIMHPDFNNVTSEFTYTTLLRYQEGIPKKNRLIPLLADFEVKPETILRWVKEQKPDVIMSFNTSHAKFLREGGYRIPEDLGFFVLSLWQPELISGVLIQREILGQHLINLLVQKLLAQEFGIPQSPLRLMFAPAWNEGTTLRPVQAKALKA